MSGRRQNEEFVNSHRDPATLPVGRFRLIEGRKVQCVLCERTGFGPVAYNPEAVYEQRPRGHRTLLVFIGDELVQVEGPDTKPELPRPMPWSVQFSPWQIGCMLDHVWPCSCGRSYRAFGDLWRHIGGERPTGWGRQEVHEYALVCDLEAVSA